MWSDRFILTQRGAESKHVSSVPNDVWDPVAFHARRSKAPDVVPMRYSIGKGVLDDRALISISGEGVICVDSEGFNSAFVLPDFETREIGVDILSSQHPLSAEYKAVCRVEGVENAVPIPRDSHLGRTWAWEDRMAVSVKDSGYLEIKSTRKGSTLLSHSPPALQTIGAEARKRRLKWHSSSGVGDANLDVQFSDDGNYLATCVSGHCVSVWNVATLPLRGDESMCGERVNSTVKPMCWLKGPFVACAWLHKRHGNRLLATSTSKGRVSVWHTLPGIASRLATIDVCTSQGEFGKVVSVSATNEEYFEVTGLLQQHSGLWFATCKLTTTSSTGGRGLGWRLSVSSYHKFAMDLSEPGWGLIHCLVPESPGPSTPKLKGLLKSCIHKPRPSLAEQQQAREKRRRVDILSVDCKLLTFNRF